MSAKPRESRINQQHDLLSGVSGALGLFNGRYGHAVEQADSGTLEATTLHELVGASLELLQASQTALTGLLLELPEPPRTDRFTMLSSSDRNMLESYLKHISTANSAISSCSDLLFKFVVDDDCGDRIPNEVKNNNVRGGLLEAIGVATNEIDEYSELLLEKVALPRSGDEYQGGAE